MYANVSTYLGMYNVPESNLRTKQYLPKENFEPDVITGSANPKVWGPPFWFTLHNSAVHYPIQASPIVKERMKHRILAIPYEIPCSNCRPHAIDFIEKNRDMLNNIVSGRHTLFQFYVDFHNKVNERYGKPIWTYEQAYEMYSGK